MEKKKKSFGRKLLRFMIELVKIAVMLSICAGIGIFLAVGNRASSPSRFAKKFFSNYITNNYEEMYKMIDIQESEFINFENYKSKCEGEKIYGSIKDYHLSKPVRQGGTVTFVATYKIGDDSTSHTYTITLRRQKEKVYKFFDTWKVSVDRFVIKDYEINVPVGTVVTLDGIDITSYKKETSEDGTQDRYVIDKIFSGDHTVAVNLDATGEITKTQYVTQDMASMTITTSDFAMKPDVQRKLNEYSVFVVNAMYQYAMDRTKNFDNISVLYNNTEEAQASAKATFEKISSGVVQENGAAVRQLELKSVKPQINAFTYPDRVTVRVNYDYSFTAVTGTTALTGIVSEYSGEGSDYADVYFNLVDGDWKIVKVDMECFDYSQQ